MTLEQLTNLFGDTYFVLYRLEDKPIYVIENQFKEKFIAKVIPSLEFDEGMYALWQKIDCPQITKIVEKFVFEDEVVYIMTFMKGKTLYDCIHEEGPFNQEQAKAVFNKLLDLFIYLHGIEDGLIYRDIHPKNILLHEDEVSLIDLDSTRIYKNDSNFDTVAIGVIGFIAPEQYGFEQSSVQSDIYSLGVLISYMLTGSYPSFNSNRINLETVEIDESFRKLLLKMTSYHKKDRPNSMVSVKNSLNHTHKKWHVLAYFSLFIALGTVALFLVVSLFPGRFQNTQDFKNAHDLEEVIKAESKDLEENTSEGSGVMTLTFDAASLKSQVKEELKEETFHRVKNNENFNLIREMGYGTLDELLLNLTFEPINHHENFNFLDPGYEIINLSAAITKEHVYLKTSFKAPESSDVIGMRFTGGDQNLSSFIYGDGCIQVGENNYYFEIPKVDLDISLEDVALEVGDVNNIIIEREVLLALWVDDESPIDVVSHESTDESEVTKEELNEVKTEVVSVNEEETREPIQDPIQGPDFHIVSPNVIFNTIAESGLENNNYAIWGLNFKNIALHPTLDLADPDYYVELMNMAMDMNFIYIEMTFFSPEVSDRLGMFLTEDRPGLKSFAVSENCIKQGLNTFYFRISRDTIETLKNDIVFSVADNQFFILPIENVTHMMDEFIRNGSFQSDPAQYGGFLLKSSYANESFPELKNSTLCSGFQAAWRNIDYVPLKELTEVSDVSIKTYSDDVYIYLDVIYKSKKSGSTEAFFLVENQSGVFAKFDKNVAVGMNSFVLKLDKESFLEVYNNNKDQITMMGFDLLEDSKEIIGIKVLDLMSLQ